MLNGFFVKTAIRYVRTYVKVRTAVRETTVYVVEDPESGAFLTPGSVVGFSGSRMATHIYKSFETIFLTKKYYNSID